ncbi:MAG: hypothetical protein HZB72_03065 [Burkholderiales bacterium]|nr:hypothetical protein [Burkholderiales bacterium]
MLISLIGAGRGPRSSRPKAISEPASESAVAEGHEQGRLIQAQSAAISSDMASICNDEQACLGGAGGHG